MNRFRFSTVAALLLTLVLAVSAAAAPWKFGVMDDTQWTTSDPAGANPNGVPVSIIKQVNRQFINQGVKFVIQVGDLTENGADADIAVRAGAAQALYDKGIGFFPMRGNHETYTAGNSFGIPAVRSNFPQTQCTGANVFGATDCTSPTLPGSFPDDLKGMSYSFDFGDAGNKARFVIIDEWVTPNKSVTAVGYPYGYSIAEQQAWISNRLDKTTRGTEHAFVFSHQNLIGENHQDTLFQGYADANPAMQNAFFASLMNNNVKYHISGHDHVHQRSLIASPDGLSSVQEIIGASNSSKFYTPKSVTDANWKGQKYRETSLSQELYTVGFYIYTVDGPRVTVEYYSDDHGNWLSDGSYPAGPANAGTHITPTFNFVKKETWGYSANGKEFLVAQGQPYTAVQDTFATTAAKILDGTNGSTRKDYTNRQLTKAVDTGWTARSGNLASDILTLWGMTDLGQTSTDTFVLSLSYDPALVPASELQSGLFGLAVRDENGKWVNAVEKNAGGVRTFVNGPWNASYGLGTYGIDTATNTAWAVINHNSEFAVTTFPWSFGVMCDTQWLQFDDGKNPNTVAVDIIKQVNQKFKDAGVKFVVQVGDLTDKGDRAAYKFCVTPGCNTGSASVPGNLWYSLDPGTFTVSGVTQAASRAAIGTRALFAQELYNAGIGFFPIRGNHEETKDSAITFTNVFPQTQTGQMNNTPSSAFSMPNPDSATQPFPTQFGSPFFMGASFSSPSVAGLTGLSYSFDFNNARFVLLDQFTRTDGSGSGFANTNIIDQLPWIGTTLAGKPTNGHAFVFSHKNLMGQNHVDMLFGANPGQNPASQTTFIDAMYNNGARYSFSGHDHIYMHSLVKAPTSTSTAHNIITGSDSNKFYIPTGNTEWTGLAANDPTKAIDNTYNNPTRETAIAQERYKISYFIVNVDASKVTVDYYSADNTGAVIDPVAKEYLISATPTLNFTKKDTFGYDLNGKEYLVAQGQPYTVVNETNGATTARILNGANGSTAKDGNGRQLTKAVTTLWTAGNSDTYSNILSLMGMTDLGQTTTDTYVLSLTYDPATVPAARIQNGGFGLANRSTDGRWINAVDMNYGGSLKYVQRAWQSGDTLGTYGVDTATNTAWAVINHASDFAVTSFADMSSLVKVISSGFLYSRVSKTFNGTLTITNTSNAAVAGPFVITLNNLTPGVTLKNASGSFNGYPQVTVSTAVLNAGQSVTAPVSFTATTTTPINFTPVTFQAQ